MSASPKRQSYCSEISDETLPDWLPDAVRVYLSHTAGGVSLRAIARRRGCHPSTILRQVRRFENRRDDPLIDDLLTRLDRAVRQSGASVIGGDPVARQIGYSPPPDAVRTPVSAVPDHPSPPAGSTPNPMQRDAVPPQAEREMMAALRHMRHSEAVLVVAQDMPKAVVMRERGQAQSERLDVIDRHLAEVMALRNWITCRKPGRISCYAISAEGESALNAADDQGDRDLADMGARGDRRIRYGQPESPVAILARRRDKSGDVFLDAALVSASDRLREDFITAQLDRMPVLMADEFLRQIRARKLQGPNIAPPGTKAARQRVIAALQELGPGLADVALRCCCFQQGVEATEAELGWSARSGKIVLRIALQRLMRHYDHLGDTHQMIG